MNNKISFEFIIGLLILIITLISFFYFSLKIDYFDNSKKINLNSNFFYIGGLTVGADVKTKGVKIEEVPYTFVDRELGSSKLDSSTIFDYFKSVWKLYKYGKTVEKDEKRTSVKFLSKAARFFTVGASGLAINYLASMIFALNSDMWVK